MHLAALVQAILGLLVGVGAGVAFFRGLRLNTELYLERLAPALALHLARFALATGAFLALAWLAPLGLLPALAGFRVVGLVLGRRAAAEATT